MYILMKNHLPSHPFTYHVQFILLDNIKTFSLPPFQAKQLILVIAVWPFHPTFLSEKNSLERSKLQCGHFWFFRRQIQESLWGIFSVGKIGCH